MVSYEEAQKVALAMTEHGGSFVSALGDALQRADFANRAKIKDAFPEYWEQYRGLAEAFETIEVEEPDNVLTEEQFEGLKHDLDKLKPKFSDDDIDHLAERLEATKKYVHGGEE